MKVAAINARVRKTRHGACRILYGEKFVKVILPLHSLITYLRYFRITRAFRKAFFTREFHFASRVSALKTVVCALQSQNIGGAKVTS